MQMIKVNVSLRLIINAINEQAARLIVGKVAGSLHHEAPATIKLSKYEDDFHFDTSLTLSIEGDSHSNLEYSLFKLCITIEKGPWLFYNLPSYNESLEGFEFEAFFNPEAFIHNDPGFLNKLKWAHLEVVTT